MSKESALSRISEQIEQANSVSFITPNTMGQVLREIVNIVPRYSLYKASFNSAPYLETGDVIAGLWDDYRYIVARYLGGGDTDLENFEVGIDQSFTY